jgi:hypothetical protein
LAEIKVLVARAAGELGRAGDFEGWRDANKIGLPTTKSSWRSMEDQQEDPAQRQLREYRNKQAKRESSVDSTTRNQNQGEREGEIEGAESYPSAPIVEQTYPAVPSMESVPSAPALEDVLPGAFPSSFPPDGVAQRPDDDAQIQADHELALRLSREENANSDPGNAGELNDMARETARAARQGTRAASVSTSNRRRINEEDRDEWDDTQSPTEERPRPSSAQDSTENRGFMGMLSSGASAVGSAASKAATSVKSWWNSKDDFQVPSTLSTTQTAPPRQAPTQPSQAEQPEGPHWAQTAASAGAAILGALLAPPDLSGGQRGYEYRSPGGGFTFRIGSGPGAFNQPQHIDPVSLMLGHAMGVPVDRMMQAQRRGMFENERARWQHQYGPGESYEDLLAMGERIGPAAARGATDGQIDQLPTRRFEKRPNSRSSSRASVSKDPVAEVEQENQNCAICLSDFEAGEELMTLPCLHQFHKECVTSWLKLNKVCPVCRVDVQAGGVQ